MNMLINGREYIIGPNSDLRNANLSGADLSGADLRGADLSGGINDEYAQTTERD